MKKSIGFKQRFLLILAILASSSFACKAFQPISSTISGIGARSPLVNPASNSPRAGHWEGTPSVSFDVTADGRILNFKMVADFITSWCTITLTEFDKTPDGNFLFGDMSKFRISPIYHRQVHRIHPLFRRL